jgi:glycolate oxidase FAD binding subunit
MNAANAALRRLTDQVIAASDSMTALDIRGGCTKAFYGGAARGEPLEAGDVRGITSYEPTELVITALAGTPLAELEVALAEGGQCLPFEPPRFAAGGTVGGMVAAGLSGPARASVGAARDHVLGMTVLNGRGELLTFGGQVMKNVAGYDVSRLFCGSLGILGVICEVSLKVMPVAPACATLTFEMGEAAALAQLHRWAALPMPLSASAWHRGRLVVRLSGARSAVKSVYERWGGSPLDPAAATLWWDSIRDHGHEFFHLTHDQLASGECLWRLSLPDTASPIEIPGEQFVEWGGAQRWLRSGAPASQIRAAAAKVGGHATLVRAADKSPGVFAAQTTPLMAIHRRLKQSFDPSGIFNPGRLYSEL